MIIMKKNSIILCACSFAFGVNLALFIIKLYIGLRTNSISIYSDAVNNMFDSLIGLITFISMFILIKKNDSLSVLTVLKSEQLFSFIMAVMVLIAGLYFGYSSLERFMYPAPIWFTMLYAGVLAATDIVKIILFFVYGKLYNKNNSPVIRVMKYDCILDFFITLMTIVSLIVSNYGSFSFDALFGLIISIIIVVSAVKMIISAGAVLINYVPSDKRDIVCNVFKDESVNLKSVTFITFSDKSEAFVECDISDDAKAKTLKEKCLEQADTEIKFIL